MPHPLDYQPPKDQPPPPTPWWKFRFDRGDIPLLIILVIGMGLVTPICGIVSGRRKPPAPTTAPASRPAVNVTLPPL